MPSSHDNELIQCLGDILLSNEHNIHEKHRALFTLKNHGSISALEKMHYALGKCESILLKHEIAYVIGQVSNPVSIPTLSSILSSPAEVPMVRHECAEALGAIGDPAAFPVLTEFLNDSESIVADSCLLAIERIKAVQDLKKGLVDQAIQKFHSIDPVLPDNETGNDDNMGAAVLISQWESILLDESLPLYKRYKAMFNLRNCNTEKSILVLCKGLKDSNPLFQHEIAFVLGQIQNPIAIPFLKDALSDKKNPAISRHECAEALGAIATKETVSILSIFLKDPEQVVRESCEVALDIGEHEAGDELHYSISGLKTMKEARTPDVV